MKFAGFSARFRRLLSLLHESKYVEEMDPQPSTFHNTPATYKLKENAEHVSQIPLTCLGKLRCVVVFVVVVAFILIRLQE